LCVANISKSTQSLVPCAPPAALGAAQVSEYRYWDAVSRGLDLKVRLLGWRAHQRAVCF
jgi:hypothetical protein